MTNSNLTDRQKAVLNFVISYRNDRGFPPTRTEIANHFGWHSNAAQDHLVSIQRKGYIKIYPGIPRGIQVIEK